jgi:hypothetical protein
MRRRRLLSGPSVSQPYSIIDGDTWVDAGSDANGCARLKNLKTGQVKVYR